MTKWSGAPRSATTTSFYSPLGLESEGTAVDFQVGVNDYSTARASFPFSRSPTGRKRSSNGCAAATAARPIIPPFRQVFGKKLDAAWDDWIAYEHQFQKDKLAKLAPIR